MIGSIRLEKKQKSAQKLGLKNMKIVLDTFPITYNEIFHGESVWNTLFYNNNMTKLIICDRL